jgi:uncharacterized protein (DUF2236 family)
VGAGVRDHSSFERDPWGRLLRTVDYLTLLVYGGSEAAAVGRRLREMHKPIRGRNPDGSRYSALEPEAYAWVHATLLEAGIAAHHRFIGPLTEHELDEMFATYLPLGRLLGVRPGDLPTGRAAFREYFDRMIADGLEHNETVDRVLRSLTAPGAPPQLPATAEPLWGALRLPPARVLELATVGLLPPALRERFGVEWS